MSTSFNHSLSQVNILSSEELSPGLFLISFKRSFNFRAGQVIGITLREDDACRLYSICSGEKEEEIRILYKVVDEGYLTPQLSDLMAGDSIWITPPGGEFTGTPEPAVWIASGTGIAPFYAMLRSALGQNKILIHGNRYLEQFHFYGEFREVLGENCIRCCTAETNRDVYHGRVTAYLEEQAELDPALKYYLCGSADMVVEVRDLLISKGVPFRHIISEIYF
ncbi:MAG: FAD-binding oxidoreductase [Bacteroidales bacterium]|nr:FAD-binding oxidoreductase [Bacteroidales bacterium]